jgi:hypothetical protein
MFLCNTNLPRDDVLAFQFISVMLPDNIYSTAFLLVHLLVVKGMDDVAIGMIHLGEEFKTMLTSYKSFLFHVIWRYGSLEIDGLERLDLLHFTLKN